MAVSIMEYEKLEDAIRLRPPSQKIAPDYSPEETVYIYLIPGNPGLIEYYRDFLTALSTHPWFNRDDIRFDILGQSLSGFEVHSSHHSRDPSPPYTLQEQVSHLQTRLDYHLSSKQGTKPVRVILVGHSVGAYILLETIARQQEAQRAASSKGSYRAYEIIGGICLFPTIVHLAKSPRGRIAAVSSVTLQATRYLVSFDFNSLLRSFQASPSLYTASSMLCLSLYRNGFGTTWSSE